MRHCAQSYWHRISQVNIQARMNKLSTDRFWCLLCSANLAAWITSAYMLTCLSALPLGIFEDKDDFILCNENTYAYLYHFSGKAIRGIWEKTSVDCYFTTLPCRLCWMWYIPINASDDICKSSCWFWWKWFGTPPKHCDS